MKSWHKIFALICLVALLFAYIGCSSRNNPADIVYPSGKVFFNGDIVSDSLKNNLIGNPIKRNVFVYVPPGYDAADFTTEYPVLYFLHGFLDTSLRYVPSTPDFPYPYGLAETADKLIATGEIQPMIIAMANCNSLLGGIDAGSFYVNSPSPTINPIPSLNKSLNGKFESFYVHEFMTWVESNFHINTDKEYQAIAGHSMGGYGAFRIAMDYPDLFGIVGSMSGPLSFEYLTDWIPDIFSVNGITESTYRNLTYESPDEATRMFFAMAAAFSPHDTSNHDLTSYFQVTPPGTDAYGVDLPFDSAQNIITSVWNIWISNDIKTRYDAGPTVLDSMHVYIDCGDADEFGFDVQSDEFYQGLTTTPYSMERFFEEYSGGGYMSADNSTYLYYRIENLLKFVSDNFSQP